MDTISRMVSGAELVAIDSERARVRSGRFWLSEVLPLPEARRELAKIRAWGVNRESSRASELSSGAIGNLVRGTVARAVKRRDANGGT